MNFSTCAINNCLTFNWKFFCVCFFNRVLMLGSEKVGKSSLVSQFMTSEYLHAYDTSIGEQEFLVNSTSFRSAQKATFCSSHTFINSLLLNFSTQLCKINYFFGSFVSMSTWSRFSCLSGRTFRFLDHIAMGIHYEKQMSFGGELINSVDRFIGPAQNLVDWKGSILGIDRDWNNSDKRVFCVQCFLILLIFLSQY